MSTPGPDGDERAARQARLSKALSAAYLTHQITQLEDKVINTSLSTSRPPRGPAGTAGGHNVERPPQAPPRQLFDDGVPPPVIRGRGGHRGRGGLPHSPPGRGGRGGRGGGGGGGGRGRGGAPENLSRDSHLTSQTGTNGVLILPPSVESNVFPFVRPHGYGGLSHGGAVVAAHNNGNGHPFGGHPHEHGAGHGHDEHGHGHGRHFRRRRREQALALEREPERFVVDVSAVLWTPGWVKSLLKIGGEVIIPLECIRTLDILKKGMSRSAIAARAATRFIEEAQRRTREHSAQSAQGEGPSSTVIAGVQGLGKALRPGLWIQNDEEVVEIFPKASLQRTESGGGDTEITDTQASAPPYIKSTLQCALFYRGQWEVPSSTNILAIAHPPMEVDADRQSLSEEDDHIRKYKGRAEGFELAEWAEKADVAFKVVDPTTKGHGKKQPAMEDRDGDLEAGAEALPERNPERFDSQRGCGRAAHRGRGRVPADMAARLPNTESEIHAMKVALAAREMSAVSLADEPTEKFAPATGGTPDFRLPAKPSAQASGTSTQLTAAALEQSQAAIAHLEQTVQPKLERPPPGVHDVAVLPRPTKTGGSDFKPLRRQEQATLRPVAQRGGRPAGGPRRGGGPGRRTESTQPPPEPVIPKMTLLQRPKG